MSHTYSSIIGLLLLVSVIAIAGFNGYLVDYVRLNIFFAYLIVFFGLSFITFGFSGVVEILHAAKVIFFRLDNVRPEVIFNLEIAIRYSYTASFVWVLGCIASGFLIEEGGLSATVVADIAVAILYGFVVSEIILRPIHHKIKAAG